MDSPVTQTTSTTLSENLKIYNELYSEYISLAVDLHNYHRTFQTHFGYRTCLGVKKSGRKINVVLKKLQKIARVIYRQNKKLHPLKRGPKGKKNGHNNSTTTKTI